MGKLRQVCDEQQYLRLTELGEALLRKTHDERVSVVCMGRRMHVLWWKRWQG